MQKPNLDYLEKTTLSKDLDHEEINNAHYQMDVLFDQHCHGIEFKHCLFENVNMQDVQFEDSYFIDVIFKDCDFSNIKLLSSLFRRVQFINCKLLGTDFSESLFDQVLLKDCLCRFANFAFMKNKEVHFEHCDLYQASIIETNLKKTTFHECNLQQCEIQHASLIHLLKVKIKL